MTNPETRFSHARRWILLGPITCGGLAALFFGATALIRHITQPDRNLALVYMLSVVCALGGIMLGVALRSLFALFSPEDQFPRSWASLALFSVLLLAALLSAGWILICIGFGRMAA
jgi:hypothetical protein